MKQKTFFITTLILLAIVFTGATLFYRGHQAEEGVRIAARNKETLVRLHSPSLGRPQAPVHIVELMAANRGTGGRKQGESGIGIAAAGASVTGARDRAPIFREASPP